MFREVIKFSKNKTTREFQEIALKKISEGFSEYNVCLNDFFKCHYQVGQKIFCKESFFANKNHNNLASKDLPVDSLIMYAAGGGANVYGKKRPAQHMKQEHSRLTLLIKNIGVERLQKLTFGDALREGASDTFEGSYDGEMLLEKFKSNWNATHKKPEEKFEANPWVWCVSF